MGSGFSKMKKQARMMEEQFGKMREEMQQKSVSGSAGNGLVTLTLNGDKELKEIKIRPECVDPNDLEGLQDLIKAAFLDAYKKLESEDSPLSSLPFGF